jgi:NADH:ubiquinone oxidoreductase subunit E
MVCDILDRHGRSRGGLIAILQEIQEACAYLPEDIMTYVATALGVSPCAVFGAATFHSHSTLSPKGGHDIKVCDGTASHVKESEDITGAFREAPGLREQAVTTVEGSSPSRRRPAWGPAARPRWRWWGPTMSTGR